MDDFYGGWLSRRLHQLFEASLLLKGFFAVTELLTGLTIFGIGPQRMMALVNWVTRNELVEDPSDPMASTAIRVAHGFSVETAHFYGYYLFAHGIIKLVMVAMLARRALWAYPAAMVILAGFVAYQLYRYTHDHSIGLLVLSALDFVMIWLVLREYWVLKANLGPQTP